MRTLTAVSFRLVLAALSLLSLAPGWSVTRAAVLTSSDGKTREFPVVVSAGRQGLIVRESVGGKDIVIPWARLDARLSAEANPWLEEAKAKAEAGESVVLNIGLEQPAAAPAPAAPAPKESEWRTVKTSVAGGPGKNFTTLALSAYVHREVAVPRLALVWVGSPSPLAKRGDAADLARRLQGALVVADFQGGAYTSAGEGSGEALVAGVADLLKQARTGKAGGKDGKEQQDGKGKKEGKNENDGEGEGEERDGGGGRANPAIIVMGRDEAATFVWSLVCARPADVVAAITLNGVHKAESTAGAFATPCLFLESPAPAEASAAAADLTRPQALWRHFSTDGCRWCYAAPAGDPLALAVTFAREVALSSPYVEALELLESWENNKLRHRIPMPVATAKSFKEDGFRLATPDGSAVFPVKSKVGAARNDLVWVPSAAFAARLAGK